MSNLSHLGGTALVGDPLTFVSDVWEKLIAKYGFKSVIDVGSGVGVNAKWFADHGLDAYCVEGFPDYLANAVMPRDRMIAHDYTKGPYAPEREFDLGWSSEFVEHVEEQYVPNFMATFKRCRFVCMTHATPGQGGYHHCVIEGTPVLAHGIKGASRRAYKGKVFTIITARGNRLTVTPNHPVLTSSGWVSTDKVTEEHHLVSRCNGEGKISVGASDHNNRPALAEQIFAAFSEMPESSLLEMPSSPKDFHGDGFANSKIHIVRPDGFLRNEVHAQVIQPVSEESFEFRPHANNPLHRDRQLVHSGPLVPSQHLSPSGQPILVAQSSYHTACCDSPINVDIAGSQRSRNNQNADAELCCNLGNQHSAPVHPNHVGFWKVDSKGFAFCPNVNSPRHQNLSGKAIIDMCGLGQNPETFSGQVSFDKVVKVVGSDFEGHVYNFETADNWYFADGIIVHNCNEQASEYWIEKMNAVGFDHFQEDTDWMRATGPNTHYGRRTLMLFKNRNLA